MKPDGLLALRETTIKHRMQNPSDINNVMQASRPFQQIHPPALRLRVFQAMLVPCRPVTLADMRTLLETPSTSTTTSLRPHPVRLQIPSSSGVPQSISFELPFKRKHIKDKNATPPPLVTDVSVDPVKVYQAS